MYATRNQEGTMQIFRGARSNLFGLLAGCLIVGLAVASLPVGLIWSDSLVRYPGAERLVRARLPIDILPNGAIGQYDEYQTVAGLPQVLGWYARNLGLVYGLGHDDPQGDNCVTMTRVDAHLSLQHSLTVTLCAHPGRTLIFVDRSLAVHW